MGSIKITFTPRDVILFLTGRYIAHRRTSTPTTTRRDAKAEDEKLLRLSGKVFICECTNAHMHNTVSPTYIICLYAYVRHSFECHNISKRNFIKAKIISKTSFHLGKRAYRLLPAPSPSRNGLQPK